MDIHSSINIFLKSLKLNNFSKDSLRTYKFCLANFSKHVSQLKILEIKDLNKQSILSYMEYLNSKKNYKNNAPLKKATKSTFLTKVKMYLLFLTDNEYIYNDYSYLFENISKGIRLPRNLLTEQEIKIVLSLPKENTYLGFRDKVIFELVYNTGLRLSEVISLDIYDINYEEKTIFVRLGKGNKDRVVPMGNYLEKYLKEYSQEVRPALILDNVTETKLFISKYGCGLTKRGLQSIIEKYKNQSELSFSCHTFRHCFATHMLKHGANLVYIQQILGHEKISTTQIYTKVYPTELKKLVENYHPRNNLEVINEEIIMPRRQNLKQLRTLLKEKKEKSS